MAKKNQVDELNELDNEFDELEDSEVEEVEEEDVESPIDELIGSEIEDSEELQQSEAETRKELVRKGEATLLEEDFHGDAEAYSQYRSIVDHMEASLSNTDMLQKMLASLVVGNNAVYKAYLPGKSAPRKAAKKAVEKVTHPGVKRFLELKNSAEAAVAKLLEGCSELQALNAFVKDQGIVAGTSTINVEGKEGAEKQTVNYEPKFYIRDTGRVRSWLVENQPEEASN